MSSSTKPPSPEQTPRSAPERRFEPVSGDWVVIAADRASRPHDLSHGIDQPQLNSCAFCAGHEAETTSAVATWPLRQGQTDDSWQVRVVPNLYPAFVNHARDSANTNGHAFTEPSCGYHDVVIESPKHLRRLTELSVEEAGVVFRAYRERLAQYASDSRIAQAIVFKNCGTTAGMSREHIHSQMVGLPFIPPVIQTELDNAQRYFANSSRCLFCDLMEQERQTMERVVKETDTFLAYCPFASRFGFEVWILPKKHLSFFEQLANDSVLELAQLMQDVLGMLEKEFNHPSYNYVIHTSPFDSCRKDHYHWHIEIIPRLSQLAGLELGTGIHINSFPPEVAAARLRQSACG